MQKYPRPAQQAWVKMLEDVLECGYVCGAQDTAGANSRKSVEVLSYTSVVEMSRPVIMSEARKLGYKFQAGEAWWILSGRDDVESITKYSSAVAKYSDDGVRFFGAYGPMFTSQLDYVVARLHEDVTTRQAVMRVWRDNPPKSRDVPCTLSWQFLIRGGLLHVVATMRSSDAWLGWPYDVFTFSCMAAYVSLCLKSRPPLGRLYLTCGSQHVYDTHLDECHKILSSHEPSSDGPVLDPSIFQNQLDFLDFMKKAADTCGSANALYAVRR